MIFVTKSLVDAKEKELAMLAKKSNNAIDVVTSTIRGLESVNAEIGDKIVEISDCQQKLDRTKKDMESMQSNNSKIIVNFMRLLEV